MCTPLSYNWSILYQKISCSHCIDMCILHICTYLDCLKYQGAFTRRLMELLCKTINHATQALVTIIGQQHANYLDQITLDIWPCQQACPLYKSLLYTELFCMQSAKAYVAETTCNQLLYIYSVIRLLRSICMRECMGQQVNQNKIASRFQYAPTLAYGCPLHKFTGYSNVRRRT